MKEWLEEKDMPKDCANCKYYVLNCADTYSCIKQNGRAIHCNFSDGMGCRHEECPLQSLSDYTKQVRKEVCEEIRKSIRDIEFLGIEDYVQDNIKKSVIHEIDQIQGTEDGNR